MTSLQNLTDLAHTARKERQARTSTLIGFCYENAEEMSRQLHKHGITHELHYVGLITDIEQFSESTYEDCVHAAETGEYVEHVPETVDELPAEANHYTIIVPSSSSRVVVEPCSEVRDEHFRNVYVGKWPTKDYLPLRDGKLDKESYFDHFS